MMTAPLPGSEGPVLRAEHDKPTARQGKKPRIKVDLKGLARRISPSSSWDDLVLPEDRVNVLREIALHVRHGLQADGDRRSEVKRQRPRLTVGALFVGPTGTGRKLAAKVIASDLQTDLYLVDLPVLLTGTQGDIAKGLRHLFVSAAQSQAVLVFDDAAVLCDTSDHADRQRAGGGRAGRSSDEAQQLAGTGTGSVLELLLRNLQELGGVMILVTESVRVIPGSFQRRLNFVLSFPFPDVAQREQIWRRVLPPRVPTSGLDLVRLARIELPGGHIRDIAQLAIHLASEQQEPVRMQHLRRAAESLYEKLGLAMSLGDFQYWL